MNKQSDHHLRRSACALGPAWLALLLTLASFSLNGAEQAVTGAGSAVLPAWLQARQTLPYQPRRDANGTLLESRVMLDEDMHWAYSPAEADAILQRIKAAGFNVYIPCIYHGGGSWYPTNLLAPDAKLAARLKQQPDPLGYLIKKAHSMGIEVHPWFTVTFRAGNFHPQFAAEGKPERAYNAQDDGFRSFIVNLMLERFVIGDARTRIQHWQEAAVKDIVTRVSTEGRKIKPGLIISVDGHPPPPGTPPSLEGRNEVDWVKSGLINVIYKMDYSRDIDAAGTDAVRKQRSMPERLITLFSNYDQREGQPATSREGALIAAYVEYAQRKWPGSGAAFYIYARMSDEQMHALRAGPFKEDARPYWPPLNG